MDINEEKKNAFIKTLSQVPPEGCNLKVGDLVHWVNDYGVEWDHKILGFQYGDEYGDKYHKHVILDSDSYWFPHGHGEFTAEEWERKRKSNLSNSF